MKLVVVGIGLILDRLLKILALERVIEISKNKGLFFFNLNQQLLVMGAGLIIAVLLVQLIKAFRDKSDVLLVGYGLIIFGGLSNLFDRLVYGYVVDMIPLLSFSVFNLADVMIIGGCALILLKVLRSKER
jgi:signal peptidase II